jgi:hypothetical protein
VGSILFIEFSYGPNVQPQTVSDGHLIGRLKPNRQFFRAVSRIEHWTIYILFLKFTESSLVRRYVFCSHGFSGLRIYVIGYLMNPKSNLRKLPDGRVVGSQTQIVKFWDSRDRSHRGTEVIAGCLGSFAAG